MDDILQNSKIIRNLGQGTYGVVALHRLRDGRQVAVKTTKNSPECVREGISATSLREIVFLKSMKHVNVVEILAFDYDVKKGSVSIVMEFGGVTLSQYCRSHAAQAASVVPTPRILHLIQQLLAGVGYIHDNHLIHRDLKPANIFVGDDGRLRIGDMGLMTHSYRCRMTPTVVTLWYRAPEILFGSTTYDCKIDIFSCALIIVELCEGMPICKGDSEISQIFAYASILGTDFPKEYMNMDHFDLQTLPKNKSTLFSRFACVRKYPVIQSMLHYSAHLRPEAKTCLRHFSSASDSTVFDDNGRKKGKKRKLSK